MFYFEKIQTYQKNAFFQKIIYLYLVSPITKHLPPSFPYLYIHVCYCSLLLSSSVLHHFGVIVETLTLYSEGPASCAPRHRTLRTGRRHSAATQRRAGPRRVSSVTMRVLPRSPPRATCCTWTPFLSPRRTPRPFFTF